MNPSDPGAGGTSKTAVTGESELQCQAYSDIQNSAKSAVPQLARSSMHLGVYAPRNAQFALAG